VSLALLICVSLFGLALGPLVAALARGEATAAAVDALALGLVPTVLIIRILPHLWSSIGTMAIVAGAVGYGAMWLADRRGHHTSDKLAPAVVYPALLVHSFTDGALLGALAMSATLSTLNAPMCAALVVHRLPEGLFLATTAPGMTRRRTLWRVAGLMLATVLGALVGDWLLRLLPDRLFDTVAAIGFGAILRLSTHSHAPALRTSSARAVAGIAFALGVALVAAIRMPSDILRAAHGSEPSLFDAWVGLFSETAPALLIALMLGAAARQWRRDAAALVVSATGGLLLSLHFLGFPNTGIRVAATLALAPLALGRNAPSPPGAEAFSSFFDVVAASAPAYLIGLVLAAATEALLPVAAGTHSSIYALVAAAVLLAVLRPIAMTPLAAVLLHKEAPVAPVMAMMVLAVLGLRPMTARWRPSRLIPCLLVVGIAAVVAGRIDEADSLPALHMLIAHHHGLAERGSALVVALLIVGSLIACGPRSWLAGDIPINASPRRSLAREALRVP
jgi:hypothetical protein